MTGQLGIQPTDDVQDPGQKTAADEPGDERHKDSGDPFQKQFPGGGVPGPDGLMEFFSVPHFSGEISQNRLLCFLLFPWKIRCFLEQSLESIGDLGSLSRPQDDLEFRSRLIDPHDPRQFFQGLPVHCPVRQLEPEPGHAVAGLEHVVPGPHQVQDGPGQVLIFHGPPPIPPRPSGHCPGSGPGSAGLLPGNSR